MDVRGDDGGKDDRGDNGIVAMLIVEGICGLDVRERELYH